MKSPAMRLTEVELSPTGDSLPADVASLIADAQARIEQLVEAQHDNPIPAFVPSDFQQVYAVLACVVQYQLAAGHQFLEWGCGVGAVTCLAAKLELAAVGIEIEPDLVAASQELAADHGVEAEFVCGSFLPAGAETWIDEQGDVAWLRTDGTDAYAEIELDVDDFDIVFSYPWPGEEQVIFDLFQHYAAVGALLVSYHGQEGVRVQRKVLR